MVIHNIQQNTDEWRALKLGKFSASSAYDLLIDKQRVGRCAEHNKGIRKDGATYTCDCPVEYRESELYMKLIKRIVEERITGNQAEGGFGGNKFTDRGLEYEDEAIESYELDTFNKVDRVGFIELDNSTGCSPDGLIGDDELVQIKCPIFSTQLDYLETNNVPAIYYPQLQFELYVSGRKYNTLYSYHPKLPRLSKKVKRDTVMINRIKDKLEIAIKEVEERVKKLG